MYTDGADALSWVVGADTVNPQLVVSASEEGGDPSFSDVAVDGRGTVLDIRSDGQGTVSIAAEDGDPIALFGFGNNPLYYEVHAGELKFDLYIDSAATDVNGTLIVKMESGAPALGFKCPSPDCRWMSGSL